ncbi:MAG TPA: hypothetical protein V6D12_08045 [Candidatus Obscuribacterales bacterium]
MSSCALLRRRSPQTAATNFLLPGWQLLAGGIIPDYPPPVAKPAAVPHLSHSPAVHAPGVPALVLPFALEILPSDPGLILLTVLCTRGQLSLIPA